MSVPVYPDKNADRPACFNDERGIHKRTAGGLCEQCGDYRPDWRWEKPSFQHSYDDGQLDGAADTCARIAAWLRAGCGTGDAHAVRSPAVVADLIERGEHLRPREG